jgi:hypothetical protein
MADFGDILDTITSDFTSVFQTVTQRPVRVSPAASIQPPTIGTSGGFAGLDFTTILLLAGLAILVIVLFMKK